MQSTAPTVDWDVVAVLHNAQREANRTQKAQVIFAYKSGRMLAHAPKPKVNRMAKNSITCIETVRPTVQSMLAPKGTFDTGGVHA